LGRFAVAVGCIWGCEGASGLRFAFKSNNSNS